MLSSFVEMKADGSTSGGCWIYTGVYTGGVNPVGPSQAGIGAVVGRTGVGMGVADEPAHPLQPRVRGSRWQAVERAQGVRLVGRGRREMDRSRRPGLPGDQGAIVPSRARSNGGPDGLAGDDPFIMQADGKGWLYAPSGLLDGPLPVHYEPVESPLRNAMHRQQANPTREMFPRRENPTSPSPPDAGSDVFPYVVTTYRLTEHHTAGGMSRWSPYLAELQPEFFCEVSPELAAERGLQHLGWATIVTARTAIEARVLVTDRMTPLTVGGRTIHQIGLPYHWGVGGGGAIVSGDSANDVMGVTLDPNVHIQESKAASCDIQPGRRPTGAALPVYVEEYRRRAGITPATGTQRVTPPEKGA